VQLSSKFGCSQEDTWSILTICNFSKYLYFGMPPKAMKFIFQTIGSVVFYKAYTDGEPFPYFIETCFVLCWWYIWPKKWTDIQEKQINIKAYLEERSAWRRASFTYAILYALWTMNAWFVTRRNLYLWESFSWAMLLGHFFDLHSKLIEGINLLWSSVRSRGRGAGRLQFTNWTPLQDLNFLKNKSQEDNP